MELKLLTAIEKIEVSSVCHLHAPPPDRSMPLQWLAPQFGMASLCRYAHSLERFVRHSFLNLRRFYLVVLGLGTPLSSPTLWNDSPPALRSVMLQGISSASLCSLKTFIFTSLSR